MKKKTYAQWYPQSKLNQVFKPLEQKWFLHQGSMTELILTQSHYKAQFEVKLLGWHTPLLEERQILSLPQGEAVWVRVLTWQLEGETIMLGRAIIPKKSAVQEGEILLNTSQALGKVLFTDLTWHRDEFEFAYLDKTHPYCLQLKTPEKNLLTRRSIFYFYQRPLLICEIFLPSLFKLCPEN